MANDRAVRGARIRDGRHGHYEKGGTPLEGWTCGEGYQRAVTGVVEAEEKMRTRSHYNTAYGVLMSAFVVAPLGALGAGLMVDDHGTRTAVIATGAAVGLTSFLIGLGMAYLASGELHDAVHLYNGP